MENVSNIFESIIDRLQEKYEMLMEGYVICDHCGEIFSIDKTISNTNGTFCQEHF